MRGTIIAVSENFHYHSLHSEVALTVMDFWNEDIAPCLACRDGCC